MRARGLGALALAASFSLAGAARAEPQANAAWATGVCGTGSEGELWQATHWCNGVRADVLFGRERGHDWAFGPYAQLSTAGFWDARWGAGLSLLAPVSDDFPLVLSLGAGAHELEAIQLESWLFWGLRSHNFHAHYSIAGGALLGFSRDWGAGGHSSLFAGIQLDALVLALPFLLAYQGLSGAPD